MKDVSAPNKHLAFLTTFLSLSNVGVHVPDSAPRFGWGGAAKIEGIRRKRHSSPFAHLYVQTHFTEMGLKELD